MLASNGKDIWRWSRMDAQIVQSREIVTDFFAALGKGDYKAAAALYQPDKYEIDNLKSIGLDTSDLVSLLEQVCAGKTRICLPVKKILPGGGLSQFDQYEVHVQFQAKYEPPPYLRSRRCPHRARVFDREVFFHYSFSLPEYCMFVKPLHYLFTFPSPNLQRSTHSLYSNQSNAYLWISTSKTFSYALTRMLQSRTITVCEICNPSPA